MSRGGRLLSRLRQAEVEYLLRPCRRDLDVRRFQIAMHDALLVRGLERFGDLSSIIQRGLHRKRAGEIFAFHQFHHQEVWPDIVELADVGVVEGSDHPRFALETLAELRRADLDGDLALQARVAGLIPLTHAAPADELRGFVGTQPLPYSMLN